MFSEIGSCLGPQMIAILDSYHVIKIKGTREIINVHWISGVLTTIFGTIFLTLTLRWFTWKKKSF